MVIEQHKNEERTKINAERRLQKRKKVTTRELHNILAKDSNWISIHHAEAHRSNLLAMSMYKYLRYGKDK
jgi:hypothetical protein